MATKAQKVAKKRAAEKARHRRAAKAKARVKARAKSNAAQKLRMEAAAKRAKSRTGTPNTRAVVPEVPKSSNATATKPRVRVKPETAAKSSNATATKPRVRVKAGTAARTSTAAKTAKPSWLRKALRFGSKALKVGGPIGAGLTAAQLIHAASGKTKKRSGNWAPPGGMDAMKDATVTANKPKAKAKQEDKPKDKPKARATTTNTGSTVRPGRGGGRLVRKAPASSTGVKPRRGGGSYKGTGSSKKADTARKAVATSKTAAATAKPKVTVNTTKRQTSTAVTAGGSEPGTTAKRKITKGNDGKPLTAFQSAFATARANGLKVFTYRGKQYTTEWATERQARLKAKQQAKPKAKRKAYTDEQWQAFSRRAKANEDSKERRRASQ